MKQAVFNMFIMTTISNKYLHYFLIIFEYIIFIFPSIIDATLKITRYKTPKESFISATVDINIIQIFNYIHYKENFLLPSIIVGVVAFFLILYVLQYYLGPPPINIKWLKTLFISIYDLIIFRYFSTIVYDSALMLCINQFNKNSLANLVLSFIFLIFIFIFCLINHSFINQCAILVNISNSQLVSNAQVYPFDSLSIEYDTVMFIMKIMIGVEVNLYNYSDSITKALLSVNAMIIVLSIGLFYWYFLLNTCLFKKNCHVYANETNNLIRKGIAIFNCIYVILGVVFFTSQVSLLHIILFGIGALNLTIIVLSIDYYVLHHYHLSKQMLSYDIILFMLLEHYDDKDIKTMAQHKLMQNICRKTHKQYCINANNDSNSTTSKANCLLCKDYSVNSMNNIYLFFKYLKSQKGIDSINAEICQLFYYKITNKTLKFFQYYYNLIRKYKDINKHYARNINMMVNIWLRKEDNADYNFIQYLIEVNTHEARVIQLLTELRQFIIKHISLKNPETVLGLSASLSDIIIKAKKIIENKMGSSALANASTINPSINLSDMNNRNINGALDYNITILRYIIETLINQQLSVLIPFKIDNLEEYLSLHYSSDQILICSIDLTSLYFQEIKIIKATGRLIANKENEFNSLNSILPRQIETAAIDLFINKVNRFRDMRTTPTKGISNNKTKGNNCSTKSFSFPVMKKELLEYIDYKFHIMKIPEDPVFIAYGYYIDNNQYSRVVLLDITQSHNISIIGFCSSLIRLLYIKSDWLGLLQDIRMKFNFNSILSKITLQKGEGNDKKNKQGTRTNTDLSIIECELNYDLYLKKYKAIVKELQSFEAFNAKTDNEMEVSSAMNKMKKYKGEPIKLQFQKVYAYDKNIVLFNMKIQNTTKDTNSISKYNKAQLEEEAQNNNVLFNMNSMSHSANSISENSLSSKTHLSNKHNSGLNLLNNELKKQISSEQKKQSITTLSMLSLNIILIIICLVFLVTQINISTQLSDLSTLYFDFKGLSWAQINYFLSITMTICYSSTPHNTAEKCINGYRRYLEDFQKNYSLPYEYDLLEYEYVVLRFKAAFGYTTLHNFNKLLFGLSNLNFKDLLNKRINYFEIKEISGEYSFIKENITFNEGMRKYINSISVLVNTPEGDSPYYNFPIYFITYNNGEYTFPFKAAKFNTAQIEIYKVIANNINFFLAFNSGDGSIRANFKELADQNFFMNVIFMVTIGILNLLLFFICQGNIHIAYKVFKALIFNIIIETETTEKSTLLKSKIDNLLLLSKLYQKNPNVIIKEIETKAKVTVKRITEQAKEKDNNYNSDSSLDAINEKNNKTHQEQFYSGNDFYHYLLSKYNILLLSIFGLFFVIIIVFDVVLMIFFLQVLDYYNYVLITYNSDQLIITLVALSTMSYITNVTDSDMAQLLNLQSYDDGVINEQIKLNIIRENSLLQYTESNSTTFPTIAQFVNYEYGQLFINTNDVYAAKVFEITGKDYRIAKDFLCEVFQILNLPNFNYVKRDMTKRTLDLYNKRSQRDYLTVYEYTSDDDFYHLNTFNIMLFIPLSKFNKEDILKPKLMDNFSVYVVLVGVYLVINLCLEVILFVVMKWGITAKLIKIQDDLFMLNNCIN